MHWFMHTHTVCDMQYTVASYLSIVWNAETLYMYLALIASYTHVGCFPEALIAIADGLHRDRTLGTNAIHL